MLHRCVLYTVGTSTTASVVRSCAKKNASRISSLVSCVCAFVCGKKKALLYYHSCVCVCVYLCVCLGVISEKVTSRKFKACVHTHKPYTHTHKQALTYRTPPLPQISSSPSLPAPLPPSLNVRGWTWY